jgi:GNAT superfamily N-acetyltransferase
VSASSESVEIRAARAADAAEMARLSAELGYPVSVMEMSRRLAAMLRDERHHVAVASRGDELLAWMHVERRISLEGGERTELMGLVVDARARRNGWGGKLVDEAERWARARGLTSLTVRSNVARDGAHPFYESLGYSRSKTQHVYTKALSPPIAAGRGAQEAPFGMPKYALLELERRWLVDVAALGDITALPYREIHDLYIAGTRLRLRKIRGPGAEVTLKLGKKYGKSGPFSEPITSVYLTETEYQAMARLPGVRARKRRYALGGGSLDLYLEPLDGIAIFEIDFRDEAAARAYEPPSFAVCEITHDAAFTGAALASRRGTPPSGDEAAE